MTNIWPSLLVLSPVLKATTGGIKGAVHMLEMRSVTPKLSRISFGVLSKIPGKKSRASQTDGENDELHLVILNLERLLNGMDAYVFLGFLHGKGWP